MAPKAKVKAVATATGKTGTELTSFVTQAAVGIVQKPSGSLLIKYVDPAESKWKTLKLDAAKGPFTVTISQ